MDIVRLFPGAEELKIEHAAKSEGTKFFQNFYLDGAEYQFCDAGEEEKSVIKRFAKLRLYELLSARFQRELPWGSLTGIRPTRLAYSEQQRGGDFKKFLEGLKVSRENIELVERVLEGQKGIYENAEGNLDLYVSLPFCPSKCDYCSFITAPIDRTRQYIPKYLESLERELEGASGLIKNLRSIYVGGGTPFALEVEDLERVLKKVSGLRKNGCEFTVEAGRPDVFTPEKLRCCKEYGVTRICINAQSFSDKTLQAIGRRHTVRQIYEAFEMARPYGFIINCDLIAGLTGESVEEFQESVSQAIGLSPENITVHTLCLKKGAKLKEEHLTEERTPTVVPLSEENLSEMIAYSRQALTEGGYAPYYLYRQKYMAGSHENVGWTKKGFASVYNIDVMEEIADNLAVGANAISKKLFRSENRIERLGSPKDLPTYLLKVDQIIEEKRILFS